MFDQIQRPLWHAQSEQASPMDCCDIWNGNEIDISSLAIRETSKNISIIEGKKERFNGRHLNVVREKEYWLSPIEYASETTAEREREIQKSEKKEMRMQEVVFGEDGEEEELGSNLLQERRAKEKRVRHRFNKEGHSTSTPKTLYPSTLSLTPIKL